MLERDMDIEFARTHESVETGRTPNIETLLRTTPHFSPEVDSTREDDTIQFGISGNEIQSVQGGMDCNFQAPTSLFQGALQGPTTGITHLHKEKTGEYSLDTKFQPACEEKFPAVDEYVGLNASSMFMSDSSVAESPGNGVFPEAEIGDNCIFAYLILTMPPEVEDEVWKYLKSALVVTQSVTEQELLLPISRNSFFCHQQIVDIPTQELRQVREISAQVTIKNYNHDMSTPYMFQMFLSVSENCLVTDDPLPYWDKMDAIVFVQLPSTGQILHPIGREVSRKDAIVNTEGLFLGSFTLQDNHIFHHIPSESVLRQKQEGGTGSQAPPPIDPGEEEVVIVDRKDVVLETNGARGGRPSHRETNQLLMTKAQVEKILEIRIRWQGLSPRQRRDNVNNADFYPFLTLNRDETAECLGVCATWLKDAIRAQGVYVWPGRPLRRTGAMLQSLKENLESTMAALKFSDPSIGETERYEREIRRYESEIRDVLDVRVGIVRSNVSQEYFSRFVSELGKQYLDPEWNALPPLSAQRHRA